MEDSEHNQAIDSKQKRLFYLRPEFYINLFFVWLAIFIVLSLVVVHPMIDEATVISGKYYCEELTFSGSGYQTAKAIFLVMSAAMLLSAVAYSVLMVYRNLNPIVAIWGGLSYLALFAIVIISSFGADAFTYGGVKESSAEVLLLPSFVLYLVLSLLLETINKLVSRQKEKNGSPYSRWQTSISIAVVLPVVLFAIVFIFAIDTLSPSYNNGCVVF